MILLIKIDDCRLEFKKALQSGLERACPGEDLTAPQLQKRLDHLLDHLMVEWVDTLENSSSSARERSNPDSSRESRSNFIASTKAQIIRARYPLAARTDLPPLNMRRQIRVSEFAHVVMLMTLESLVSIPGGALHQLIMNRTPLDSETLYAALATAAVMLVASLRDLMKNPRLEKDEHCVFIMACEHSNASEGFVVGDVASWYRRNKGACSIPAKRHWRCAYRENMRNCLFEGKVLESSREPLLKRLCLKDFLLKETANGQDRYFVRHYVMTECLIESAN